MNKVEICIKKILFYIIFLMAVLIIPTMFVKAESNKKSPKTIESFKIDNTKGECDFTYNLEDAADWMENITGIKKMSKQFLYLNIQLVWKVQLLQ